MESDIAIRVENLSKAYKLYDNPVDRLKESIHPFRKKYHRDFYALNNIDFEVKKGESIGIIGKNGSGKSTLLKILTGVLTPTTGTVIVNGKVASLLELGAGFNFEMTGIENVYFNGTVMGFSKQEMDAKLDAILSFADIGDFVHQPVKTYSTGMFVRLAFASAISVDPDILIVDEALSVGDIFFQQKCHTRMEELIKNGTTVIIVSHDMPSIEKYSDRVLLINHGEAVFMGHPNEAVHRYYALLLNKRARTAINLSSDAKHIHNNKLPGCNGGIKDWPSENAFFDISNIIIIGNNEIVKCRKIALCNQDGQSCTSFCIGETAIFYTEFEALEDTDVPITGIEIINNMNLVLHSKGTLHHLVKAPPFLRKGQIIRFSQRLKLLLAPGDYTFIVAFATMKAEDYEHAHEMEAALLHSKINAVFRISQKEKITVREKEDGLRLPFYGFVDLEGDAACELSSA